MSRKAGFTLVEIMIVVAIIALVAGMALPAFARARGRSQNAKFINAARVAGDAFTMYAMERNGFPADGMPGVVPPGMETYLGRFPWTQPTPLGGVWDWDVNWGGLRAAVTAFSVTAPSAQLQQLDETFDNGDGRTGLFRFGHSASYVLEE